MYTRSGTSGEMLLVAGTTVGRGTMFVTTGRGAATTDAQPGDLDWFLMKIRAGKREFVGHGTFDIEKKITCCRRTASASESSRCGTARSLRVMVP